MSSDTPPERAAAGPRNRRDVPRELRWLLIGMCAAVVCGGLGFIYKLAQFYRETQTEEVAAFAFPVLIYLTMALGFACLLFWAASRGMFHDIEAPKYRMLEREEDYERKGI